MTHRGQNNGPRNPVQVGLDSHYTRDGHEDEAGYVQQPTLKNSIHQLDQEWSPGHLNTGMNLPPSLPCTVQSCDNELESADKTGNWNTLQCVNWLGRALDVAMAMEDTFWAQQFKIGYVTALDGWPREHSILQCTCIMWNFTILTNE